MELALKISLFKQWLRLVDWLNTLLLSPHLSDRLYHLFFSLMKSNSAQLTSEVPIQTIDKLRASMKSNQNKCENVKTRRLVIDSCPVDHNKEGLTEYALLCYNHRVHCGRKDRSNYEMGMASSCTDNIHLRVKSRLLIISLWCIRRNGHISITNAVISLKIVLMFAHRLL